MKFGNSSMNKPTLVLLHGWGNDSRTWAPIIEGLRAIAPVQTIDLPGFGAAPALSDYSLETLLAALESQLPERCVLLGWSLGGMLAVQLAARLPQRVLGVVSLAANARFVAAADYPQAMAPEVNRLFNESFAQQPQAALKRFAGLMAQGDTEERHLLKQLRGQVGDAVVTANWLPALELLAQLDNRVHLAQLTQPLLQVLAEGDALVPVAAVAALQALNPRHQIQVLAGAHALHWSQPQALLAAVQGFYAQWQALAPDKKRIAQSFGKAAATYDSVAELQRAVGAELLTRLPPLSAGQRLLDLGSGTGYFSAQLVQTGAEVIALDIAQGMLAHARQQQAAKLHQPHWLCADAEQLPLADASLNLVFSSLAIQWCASLPQLMQELARVLKPGGSALLSTLGPGTLAELKRAWQQVDDHVHVNHFAPREALEAAAEQAGLRTEFSQELRCLHFAQLRDLTHALKALGAHNINPGQPQGLTGRQRLQAFSAAYERERMAEGLPATYEVYYLVLTKATNSHD